MSHCIYVICYWPNSIKLHVFLCNFSIFKEKENETQTQKFEKKSLKRESQC